MERKLATVQGSIEFRNVVMAADREGESVHVRLHGFEAPTYRILPRLVYPFQRITMSDLFKMHWAPVYMEDFAQALSDAGDEAEIDVFVLDIPGRAAYGK